MTANQFFQELRKIVTTSPKRPTDVLNSEDCEYASSVYYSKGLYWAFDVLKSKDCAYIQDSGLCVNCYDCDFASESELCYESVDINKCYNCSYLEDCINMRDAHFCARCSNCQDVFGCVRLKNKSFCIFNRQLTEQEYREQVKKYQSWPAEKVLQIVEDLKKCLPITQTHEEHNENSNFGNYIYYNKNCYLCFDAAYNEYSGYLFDCLRNKTCYDLTLSGDNQLSYEVVDSAQLFNSNYIVWSSHCQDSSYLFDCFDVKNSIGCAHLGHKQYCILNRQLSREDYERIAPLLLSELQDKNLGWDDLVY